MRWPDNINFVFKQGNSPLVKTIIDVELIANKKNNYSLGYFLTDNKGIFLLKKNFIKETINKNLTEFPMDYSDLLDDLNTLIIKIPCKATLKRKISLLSEFYPESAIELSLILNDANWFPAEDINKRVLIKPDTSKLTIDLDV